MPLYQRDDGLGRLLDSLTRHVAPEIPIDGLFRRLAWRRLRIAALVLGACASPLLALLLLHEKPEPPVNLKLRIVNLKNPVDPPGRDPPELNLP